MKTTMLRRATTTLSRSPLISNQTARYHNSKNLMQQVVKQQPPQQQTMNKNKSQFWDQVSQEYDQSFFGVFTNRMTREMIQLSHLSRPQFLMSSNASCPVVRILDLGAGTGSMCLSLVEHLKRQYQAPNRVESDNNRMNERKTMNFEIVATDISSEMIQQLKQTLKLAFANSNNRGDDITVKSGESDSDELNIGFVGATHDVNIRIRPMVMDGTDMSQHFMDNTFDLVFCNFVLMFFGDRSAGLREMYRVLKPETGQVLISGWTSPHENPACIALYESMAQLSRSTLDDILTRHKDNFSLSDLSAMRREVEQAGFD